MRPYVVRRLRPIPRDGIALHLVEGIQWNSVQVLNMWVAIAVGRKDFKVKGQISHSQIKDILHVTRYFQLLSTLRLKKRVTLFRWWFRHILTDFQNFFTAGAS